MSDLKKVADFIIKIIIVFTTLLSLISFAGEYNSFTFGFIALLFLTSIILKGILDIFFKENN